MKVTIRPVRPRQVAAVLAVRMADASAVTPTSDDICPLAAVLALICSCACAAAAAGGPATTKIAPAVGSVADEPSLVAGCGLVPLSETCAQDDYAGSRDYPPQHEK